MPVKKGCCLKSSMPFWPSRCSLLQISLRMRSLASSDTSVTWSGNWKRSWERKSWNILEHFRVRIYQLSLPNYTSYGGLRCAPLVKSHTKLHEKVNFYLIVRLRWLIQNKIVKERQKEFLIQNFYNSLFLFYTKQDTQTKYCLGQLKEAMGYLEMKGDLLCRFSKSWFCFWG